jgi:transposase-like protein
MLRKRRQFTDAQKLSMVAELTDPDVTVASVARRHQVSTSMLFRWRDEFGLAPKHDPLLMTAKVVERPRRGRRKQSHALVLHDLLPKPEGMIAVELPDGRRVFVPAGSDPDVVRKHIAAQEMNR